MARIRVALGALLLTFGITDIAILNFSIAPRFARERMVAPETAETAENRQAPLSMPNSSLPPAGSAAPAAAIPDIAPAQADVGRPVPDAVPYLGFNRDSTQLNAKSAMDLADAARALVRQPNLRVLLRGHTCSLGTSDYNLDLSRRRAVAVRAFLVARGVAGERIAIEAVGGAEPLDTTERASALAKNRRVELVWR